MQLVARFIAWCIGLVIVLTILVTIPMTAEGMTDSLPKWITLTYILGVYLLGVALMVGDLVLFAWKGKSVWQWLRGFHKISSALAAFNRYLDRAANATLAVIGILVLVAAVAGLLWLVHIGLRTTIATNVLLVVIAGLLLVLVSRLK